MLERRGAHAARRPRSCSSRKRILRATPFVATKGANDPGSSATATSAQIRVSTRSASWRSSWAIASACAAHAAVAAAHGSWGGSTSPARPFFQRLGAVGRPERTQLSPAPRGRLVLRLAALRQSIAQRMPVAVPGTAGAIGVALLAGLPGALPDQIGTSGRSPESRISCPSPGFIWLGRRHRDLRSARAP